MRYSPETTQSLSAGGVAVVPTDTIYGIVCSALREQSVERVYDIRRRRPEKPCIILIADSADVEQFDITLDEPTRKILDALWPGPVSIVLPCESERFTYLHRGTRTLAFRVPLDEGLRESLRQTGPLIAPSANLEGATPATTTDEARGYFGDQVDVYEDAGPRTGAPSTVVAVENGKVVVLRQGVAMIPTHLR